MLVYSEFNGVHIEFEIQFIDGSVSQGYKYLAHGNNSEEFKVHLEENPQDYLKNQYTLEPGEYSYYLRRLEYSYNNSLLYRLIEPVEVRLIEIESITINKLITASYAIGIIGDYKWSDRLWMNTEPVLKYFEGEGMCSYDIIIHKSGAVPDEVIEQIQAIINEADIKLKVKAETIENSINSDDEYYEQMKVIYDERKRSLEPYFEQYQNLKTVIISMCTC